MKDVRNQFPILRKKHRGKEIVYLDSAATTQKPQRVINAITHFYQESNANIHRGVYQLSEKATDLYHEARHVVADLLNANEKEIIFTRSTTESMNILAHSLAPLMQGKNEIVVTALEHHANLIPWQQLAKRQGWTLKVIDLKDDLSLDYSDAEKKITEKTGVVAFVHISNAIGVVNDASRLIQLAHKKGAFAVVDAAQSVAHMRIDVRSLDCDFLAFSGHKVYGPTGIGVLFGKRALLDRMEPHHFGGDMIRHVTYEDASWNDVPMKFEAGTPNIAGAVGLAEAIRFILEIGLDAIRKWEEELTAYAITQLKSITGVKVIPEHTARRAGIISFVVDGMHAHDVASLLDDEAVCVRAGHHCAMPLMQKLKVSGTARISFGAYNTFDDIDRCVEALKNAQRVFQKEKIWTTH